ncbi:FtsX-like permease family protein [Streptomyces sp. PU-14G]|uniref:FtsX-like permease family protein n=1 Tax=Streptomyces sp. PU-14G TaxID=2800808 RepID=UPI0034DDF658
MAGFVVARMRAHRLLVASALLSVLLATSVLATLAAFATAVGDAGPRRALEHQSAPRTVLDIRSDITAEDRDATDAAVREAARDAFGGLPVRTAASTHSGAYALPSSLRPRTPHDGATTGTPDTSDTPDTSGSSRSSGSSDSPGSSRDDEPDLTRFATFDRARVTMVAGSWPRTADTDGRTVGAAVPQRAAERLSLRPGDTFRVTSRLEGPPDVRVEVTGVYAPASPGSPYWKWLDPLAGQGMAVRDFTTYGPLAVPDGAFTRGPRDTGGPLWPAETRWQADADFTGLDTSRLDTLGDDVARAADRIGTSPLTPHAVATTHLPELLDSLARSLLVMRSTLLITALQLLLLTGLTLLLVAQLLHTERAPQTALLRARGASRTRVCALAAAEALLLALPAAVAAPLLAHPAVRWLTGHGALARAGVDPVAGLPAGSWWVAAATATGCALLIALPTLRARGRAGDDDPEHNAARGGPRAPSPRRRTAATLLRGGADLALVTLAAVAYWQLERRSGGTGVLSARESPGARGGADGTLGIDPVLVAAPALALLAGTVLVLRVLPLAARLGERYATRARGLAPALAGWQLSRRPLRGAGPALLLVLAVATGVFAVGQGASWDRSQDDQADFRTGADISVSGSATPPLAQGGLLTGLHGVEGVAPVARASFSTAGDRTAQLLATDASRAGDGVLRLRDDLADEPLSRLLRPLAGEDRAQTGVRLPQGTREVRLRVRLDRERASAEDNKGASADADADTDTDTDVDADTDADSSGTDTLSLTVEDRFGVPYRIPLGDVPDDGRTHTRSAALAQGGGTPAGPVRLTGIEVSYRAPAHNRQRRLTVEKLSATGPHGSRTVHPSRQERWTPRVRADDAQASLGRGPHADADAGKAELRPDGATLTARHTTGSAPPPVPYQTGPVTVTVLWSPDTPPAGAHRPAAAVATDAYLRASGTEVGDTVTVDALGTELSVRITGAVRALPTVSPTPTADGESSAGALLFDLGTLNRTLADRDATLLEPRTWWLSVAEGAGDRVAGKLRAEPAVGAVRVRDEVAAELRGDPLGAGPRGALAALAPAAAVLAATGFAVSAAGAARERAAEFAVLRALGAPRRRLAHALAAEQGLVLVLSVALGLGLGALLVRLMVPLIVVTGDARAPVPDLLVRLPVGETAALLAALLAVPLLLVAATAFRRAGPATAARTKATAARTKATAARTEAIALRTERGD